MAHFLQDRTIRSEVYHLDDVMGNVLLYSVLIATRTFDKDLELVVFYEAFLDVDLEGEQQREEELVDLVDAATRVAERLIRQVVDD